MKLTESHLRRMIRKELRGKRNLNETKYFIYEEEYEDAPEDVDSGVYLMKQTYEVYDEEDLEAGDTDKRGWEIGPQPKMFETLEELVKRVEDDWSWLEWSSSPASPGDWIIGDSEMDYGTGEYEKRDLFIEHCDGTPLTDEEMDYISARLNLYGA